jgi:hypothetical protein
LLSITPTTLFKKVEGTAEIEELEEIDEEFEEEEEETTPLPKEPK